MTVTKLADFFEFYHSKDDLPGNLRVLFAELHVATIRYRLDLNTWYVCFVSDNDHYYPQSSMEECFNAICIRLGVFNDLDRIAEFGEVPAMPLPDRSL